MVRTLRRSRLRQTRGRNFRGGLHGEHPLGEVQRAPGPRFGARVVRDHDDRLAVLGVEGLQQVEDLVARLPIEVAGRLVAQQQRRVRHDGAGDADPWFLPARELPRIVLRAVLEADHRERRRHVVPPVGARERREQQRQLDVLLRRQHRQQVVELEDEADVPGAPARQPPAGEVVDADPGEGDEPSVGVSRPPIRFSRVVLPDPDGPIRARKSPCGVWRSTPRRTPICSAPRRNTCGRCGRLPALRWSSSWLRTVSLFLGRRKRASACCYDPDQPFITGMRLWRPQDPPGTMTSTSR